MKAACAAPGCARPLPPGRRRFCSDTCRVKGQRAERRYETEEIAAAVRRLIRVVARRADGGLAALSGIREEADRALAAAVGVLRARGYSDGEIGSALGISRQAVGQRFGRKGRVHGGGEAAS